MTRYVPCAPFDVPSGVRFDTPGRFQGQHLVVQFGGFDRHEHDHGAPFKRVGDQGSAGWDCFKAVPA